MGNGEILPHLKPNCHCIEQSIDANSNFNKLSGDTKPKLISKFWSKKRYKNQAIHFPKRLTYP